MADLEPFLRFWRALDEVFDLVEPTRWGAVVTDARFPRIQEGNYARVETTDPALALHEVEAALWPALDRSGCDRAHVVLFFPETLTDLVAEASTRGDKVTWDLVMEFHGRPPTLPDDGVEEVARFDARFWRAHRRSARHFGITEEETLDQLRSIERDLMLPAGRRWFVVRERGRPVAFASLLVLEGIAWVDHVVTFPRSRRRGHATALTLRVLAEARAQGAARTYLLAEPEAAAAVLYRRLGFRVVTHLASWTSSRDPA